MPIDNDPPPCNCGPCTRLRARMAEQQALDPTSCSSCGTEEGTLYTIKWTDPYGSVRNYRYCSRCLLQNNFTVCGSTLDSRTQIRQRREEVIRTFTDSERYHRGYEELFAERGLDYYVPVPTDELVQQAAEARTTEHGCGALVTRYRSTGYGHYDNNSRYLCVGCIANLCANCSTPPPEDGDPHQVADDGNRVCEECINDLNNEYGWCSACDDLAVLDDNNECNGCRPQQIYCDQCSDYHMEPACPQIMLNYSHKPEPNFWRIEAGTPAYDYDPDTAPNELYLGMELEMEANGDRSAYAQWLHEHDEEREYAYLKPDGSLNDGIEYVTHPATLEAHMQMLPFSTFDRIADSGGRSFNTDTAGMHIHLSRAAFGEKRQVTKYRVHDEYMYDVDGNHVYDSLGYRRTQTIRTPYTEYGYGASAHLWRFLKFHHMNVDKVTRVAGRGSVNYSSWTEDERAKVMEYAKGKDKNYERYVAINLQNEETIELRYFRGTLNPNGIKRNLQFAHAVYTYTKGLTFSQVQQDAALDWEAFRTWLTGREEYKALVAFLDRKGL